MDSTLITIIAAFIIIVLVIFKFRVEIEITFKAFGAVFKLTARDKEQPAPDKTQAPPSGDQRPQIADQSDGVAPDDEMDDADPISNHHGEVTAKKK